MNSVRKSWGKFIPTPRGARRRTRRLLLGCVGCGAAGPAGTKIYMCAAHAMGCAGSTQWHRKNTKWRLHNMHAKAARARVSFREARKHIAHDEKI